MGIDRNKLIRKKRKHFVLTVLAIQMSITGPGLFLFRNRTTTPAFQNTATTRQSNNTKTNTTVSSTSTNATLKLKCALWQDNLDNWWQEHPEWEVFYEHENDTHTCFHRIANKKKRHSSKRSTTFNFTRIVPRPNTDFCSEADIRRRLVGSWRAFTFPSTEGYPRSGPNTGGTSPGCTR
jgi:hypothetical protein